MVQYVVNHRFQTLLAYERIATKNSISNQRLKLNLITLHFYNIPYEKYSSCFWMLKKKNTEKLLITNT